MWGVRREGICRSVSQEASNSICVKMINPIEAKGSAFVGEFVSSLILPGVHSRTICEHAISRLPRSTTKEAVVAARPGFVPRRSIRVGLNNGAALGIEVVSYMNCVMGDTVNCDRRSRPEVMGAP